ncbi:MAG: NAD(P)/FAD-dependent oxidoreductase [Chloroflexi bacterium]|nr:NAD(P)/FAD-dependent oxidoreductase [Chloroflexota bacterium]
MTTLNDAYDVLIIGQGAAGYAAAMYAARYQMKPVIFGATFGGETATGGLIENYPGYPEIDGYELMLKFREQAVKYDVPIVDEDVASIERREDCFVATTFEGREYQGASVILAVGRERRKLGLAREDEWTGRGVSFCSTCDAPLTRNRRVVVVGGGDAAVKGAVLTSKYAEKVYIVYRGESFTRPEAANLAALKERENVEAVFSTNVIELLGDNSGLTGVRLDNPLDGSNTLDIEHLFIEIGADPRTELPRLLGVALNERNEVMVDRFMRTSVPGVFAAGDLTDGAGDLKQTITAAAHGAHAATSAYEYVSKHGNRCELHAVGYSLA